MYLTICKEAPEKLNSYHGSGRYAYNSQVHQVKGLPPINLVLIRHLFGPANPAASPVPLDVEKCCHIANVKSSHSLVSNNVTAAVTTSYYSSSQEDVIQDFFDFFVKYCPRRNSSRHNSREPTGEIEKD